METGLIGQGAGLPHRDEHALHDAFRARHCSVRQDEQEFLAADAAENVRLAHMALQRDGEVLQHGVTDAVTEAVVDVFEIVDVEDREAAGIPIAAIGACSPSILSSN